MRIVSKVVSVALGASMFLNFGYGIALGDEASVFFATGSSAAKASPALKKAAKRVAKGSAIHISGSTDPRGSDEINRQLRQQRAESVKKLLVAAGIDEGQITIEDDAAPGSSDPKTFAKQRKATMRYEAQAAAVAVRETTEPKETPAPKETPVAKETPKETAMNNTPKETGKPPQDKKLEPISLIYWRSLNHALWIVAKEKGYFAEEGFDVTLKETDEDARAISRHITATHVAGGVQTTHALEKGQAKYAAGAVCGFAAHEAMARNEPIVDIGSMIMMPEALIMKKDVAALLDKDIRALKDKKIGSITAGEGEHDFKYNNVLRNHLEKAGMIEKRDYQIVDYTDFNKELGDLTSGKIDVAKVFPPQDVEFVRQHPEYTRVPFAKFFPYLPCCRQLVTRSQLKENRGKYVRLLRASIRAHEFVIEHPTEAAQLIGKALGIQPSLVRASIMSSYVSLTPDPMRKGVELYQRTNDRYTGTKTSTAEYMDTSLYRDALFSLAKEEETPATKGYFDTMIARYRANN